jgi:hypothetical protein
MATITVKRFFFIQYNGGILHILCPQSLNEEFGKMLVEELNRFQAAADDSYSEVGEAFTRSDPNIWNFIKVAEDDLNTYLAAQREYTEGFGSGEIPPDFRMPATHLIPTTSWRDSTLQGAMRNSDLNGSLLD